MQLNMLSQFLTVGNRITHTCFVIHHQNLNMRRHTEVHTLDYTGDLYTYINLLLHLLTMFFILSVFNIGLLSELVDR